MRKLFGWNPLLTWTAASMLVISGVAGCAPATQNTTVNPLGTPIPSPLMHEPASWQAVIQGARQDQQAGMYMVKMQVSTAQGSLHSGFSVYGSINLPDRAALSITDNGDSEGYFQQGKSAYTKADYRWQQVDPLPNLDLSGSYLKLASRAASAAVPLTKVQDHVFVVNEFCTVYQATVPASLVVRLAGQPLNGEMSDVVYTFYVGNKSGYLLEVSTESVGASGEVGTMQVNSDTELFGFGKDTSQVKVPNDLFASLSR
ncbi:MAG: hypothetical protein K6T83_20215 [Alicyclobacillus sp.]|nr:hypothetical protein [Alicyclobacillus sp.]